MILVAGVGYLHMRDLSFGPILVERLRELGWPEDVLIEDFSWGPISILHWFEEEPGRKFEKAIFAGAIERGREPGTLSTYAWTNDRPDPDLVQERISEALTGVIGLENLLVIAQHFDVLPPETSVVELEPVELQWGLELSPLGEERVQQTIAWIRHKVQAGATASDNGQKEVRNR